MNTKIVLFFFLFISPFLGVSIGYAISSSSLAYQYDVVEDYNAHEIGVPKYTIENLPNPKVDGQTFFVSNPNGILSTYTVQILNDQCQQIESVTGAEYAIVVVNDYFGDSDFDFAFALFNKWGIGKKNANNGLLLFISKNTREYRFISGYGLESIFPDAYLKRVGEKFLVPNFRNGDYDTGVLEASAFITKILESPDSIKELERLMPEAVSFWSLKSSLFLNSLLILSVVIVLYLYIHFITNRILKSRHKKARLLGPIFQGLGCFVGLLFLSSFVFILIFNNIKEVYQVSHVPYFILLVGLIILTKKMADGRNQIKENCYDTESLVNGYKTYLRWLFVPSIIIPFSWLDIVIIIRSLQRNQPKLIPPDATGDWIRMSRPDKGSHKKILSQGERNEEKVGSRRYEIWKNVSSGEILAIPWKVNAAIKQCPQCHFHTLVIGITKTLKAATYSSSGEGEIYDACRNCSFRSEPTRFKIKVKERVVYSDSDSSSSSSSSSSGGGSSSSGGSFGGGSSGGGGAGGRW